LFILTSFYRPARIAVLKARKGSGIPRAHPGQVVLPA
jgi:hypothetical protein